MSPSEYAEMDAMLIARGYKIVGRVSPAIDGATDDEIDLLFGDRQQWAARELRRMAVSQPALEPESAVS